MMVMLIIVSTGKEVKDIFLMLSATLQKKQTKKL